MLSRFVKLLSAPPGPTPLGLLDFDPEIRSRLHFALCEKAIVPEIYSLLCWSTGWMGSHRFYTGHLYRGLTAFLLTTATLIAMTGAVLNMDLSSLTFAVLSTFATLSLWIFELMVQDRAARRAQVAREQHMLRWLKEKTESSKTNGSGLPPLPLS